LDLGRLGKVPLVHKVPLVQQDADRLSACAAGENSGQLRADSAYAAFACAIPNQAGSRPSTLAVTVANSGDPSTRETRNAASSSIPR
jgi:hypothetical protein